jgi:hypothetical protein
MARETITLAGVEAEILYDGPVFLEMAGRAKVLVGEAGMDGRRLVIYEVAGESAHDFVDALIGIMPSGIGPPHPYRRDPAMACAEVEATLVPRPFSWRDFLPWNWSKPSFPPDRWRVRAIYDKPNFDVNGSVALTVGSSGPLGRE